VSIGSVGGRVAERTQGAWREQFPVSEHGASAVEYCLVLAGIAAMVAIIIFTLGPVAAGPWSGACNSINVVAPEGAC
jgi:Flp pilus assembly pilin Flp